MSILLKGFKLPDSCRNCRLKDWTTKGETYCIVNGMTLAEDYTEVPTFRRADGCPIVEIKTPHGDLIDRQKLIEDNKHLEYPTDEKYRRDRAWAVGFNSGARHCNEHAVYAKTVIEAEEAEE